MINKCQLPREKRKGIGEKYLAISVIFLKKYQNKNFTCKNKRSKVNVPNVTNLLNQVEKCPVICHFLNFSFFEIFIIQNRKQIV